MAVPEDFDALFEEQWDSIVRSLTLVLESREAAEDAASVGFERALRKWRRVAAMERPGTWIYMVALRHARRHLNMDDGIGDSVPDTSAPDLADGVIDHVWLGRALAQLPDRQRAVVVLRYHAGLRISDIASGLGIAEGTVKATLHAARRRLRVEVGDRGQGESPFEPEGSTG